MLSCQCRDSYPQANGAFGLELRMTTLAGSRSKVLTVDDRNSA